MVDLEDDRKGPTGFWSGQMGKWWYHQSRELIQGNSLAVQWSGHRAFTAKGPGSIPGQGTNIPQAAWCSKKKERERERERERVNSGRKGGFFVVFFFFLEKARQGFIK